MSELDRLRELLLDSGREYLDRSGDITIGYYTDDPHSATESIDGTLIVTGLTAEQVMRALELENPEKLRVFASCAYGIASEFMRLNGCPYHDNGMECNFSEECEGIACAEHPDCLLDVLAKGLGIEVAP
jgi:hypothetical protein